MSAKTILQIKNLDISFRTNAGVVHAIRGINLDLQKGETVAIVGESGSGKSVTVKLPKSTILSPIISIFASLWKTC